MKKADLKKKWSKYCDTDKLVDDVARLLTQYNHKNTEHGICVLLDTYFKNKEPLIRLFMDSNHYVGDMRILLEKEFDRQPDGNEIYRFFNKFHDAIGSTQMIKTKDDKGKAMLDYLDVGVKSFDLSELTKLEQDCALNGIRAFDYYNRATTKSMLQYDEFIKYISYFASRYFSTMPQDLSYCSDKTSKPLELKKGTKMSRAFNTVCTHYGVDKFNPQVTKVEKDGQLVDKTIYPYNKLLAEYSDLVSDLKRKMSFYISLNPLDYLTMSFGVSWVSCHNISNGGYKGGCLSYMLDGTSMVTFVINKAEDKPVHEIPKLYRQMYHYSNWLFVQNRLYPQGNDGATNLYDKFRDFIVEEFSEVLGVDGDWIAKVGKNECGNHVYSEGVHYKDYLYNNSCGIFYPEEKENVVKRHVMTIGHDGICVRCGAEYTASNRLNHAYLNECREVPV